MRKKMWMTTDNSNGKTDEQNKNLSADMDISRRTLLGALGVGSLLTTSMPASAQEVDSESDLWTQLYSGQLTERPDAGVSGRYFHAYDTGHLFLDDGDSWSLIDFGVNSIHTDNARIGAGFADSTKHIPPEGLPFTTEEPVEIWVDSANGNNSNAGTETSPVSTIAEAWDRVAALQMNHPFAVKIKPGTYTGRIPRLPPRMFVGHEPHTGPFSLLQGQGDNPEDVVVQVELDVPVFCVEPDDPLLENFQMDRTLRPKGGHFRIDDVVFTGDGEMPTGAAIKAHNTCKLQARRCEFQRGCDYAVDMTMGGEVYLNKPSGVVSDYAIHAANSGRVFLELDSQGFGGERGLYDLGSGGQLISRDGRNYRSDRYLTDDFADGRFDEHRMMTQAFAHRPAWRVDSGSPTAGNGYVELGSGDTIEVTTHGGMRMVNGHWEFEWEYQAAPAGGSLMLHCWANGGTDARRIQINPAGDFELQRRVDSANITEVSSTWSVDQNRHTAMVTRSEDIDGSGNAGVELFLDGESQGMDTNTVIQDVTGFPEVRLWNDSDVPVRIYTVSVEKL